MINYATSHFRELTNQYRLNGTLAKYYFVDQSNQDFLWFSFTALTPIYLFISCKPNVHCSLSPLIVIIATIACMASKATTRSVDGRGLENRQKSRSVRTMHKGQEDTTMDSVRDSGQGSLLQSCSTLQELLMEKPWQTMEKKTNKTTNKYQWTQCFCLCF